MYVAVGASDNNGIRLAGINNIACAIIIIINITIITIACTIYGVGIGCCQQSCKRSWKTIKTIKTLKHCNKTFNIQQHTLLRHWNNFQPL